MRKPISAKDYALGDISEWLRDRVHHEGTAKDYASWTVTSNALDTTEQRRLNRELGLHKVNKGA
jgi:hypothetical protein